MTSFKLKFAVIAALGALATPTFAAWEALPITGFAVTGTGAGTHQPTGGTTPYKICNPNGNYGSALVVPVSAVCKSPVSPTSILQSPETGFTLAGSNSGDILMNNALTNNVAIKIGTYQSVVFRNAAKTECIYGTQHGLLNVDYYTAAAVAPLNSAGTQTFEVNGIALGGFAASGTVSISYANIQANSETVYRAGRTFTSVQHRALDTSAGAPIGGNTPAPGYYNLPVTPAIPGILASITGTNAAALSSPTQAQQSANLDPNWVEFTTDVNSLDPDGSSAANSPTVYVKAACNATTPVATDNAVRLRLTWQEQTIAPSTYPQAFVEVRYKGFMPPSGAATPAPVNPF
ncbi:MAG: hypothetical protein NTU92_09370 [Methylotenera sp.]|nr:hypothetical protein [Methylotenera sp.]